MGFNSGYAGMVTVTPDGARTAAAIYWLAGEIPRTLSLDGQQIATDAGITATLGGTLFLAPPEPVFRAAEPDRIALDLRAWGALTLSLGSVEILARNVLMTARVSAHPTLEINNGKLSAGIGDDITVATSQITSIGGGPIPDDIDRMINSADATAGLTILLRDALAGAGLMLPPVTIPYLSDPAFSSFVTLARLAYRVVDDAFVLGVDSDGPLVVTHGDPTKLTDFHVDHPLSAWVSRRLLDPILQTQQQTFADAVKKDDGTLETFAIALADGYIDVQAGVKKFGGSADIDFHLVPVLTESGIGRVWIGPVYGGAYTLVQYPASIYLAPVDIVVNVQTDAWVKFASAFGGLVTFGAVSFVIAGMTQSSRSSAVQTIADKAKIGLGDSRVFTVTLPGTTGPKVTFSADRVDFHEHGGLVETTITAAIADGAIFGPGNTALLRSATNRGLTWRVSPPQLCDPADPQLRVRWQLRRVDTNEMVFQQDAAAAGNLTVTAIDRQRGATAKNPVLHVLPGLPGTWRPDRGLVQRTRRCVRVGPDRPCPPVRAVEPRSQRPPGNELPGWDERVARRANRAAHIQNSPHRLRGTLPDGRAGHIPVRQADRHALPGRVAVPCGPARRTPRAGL